MSNTMNLYHPVSEKKTGRKMKPRIVRCNPASKSYEPTDLSGTPKEYILLSHDELEALRLKNVDRLGIIPGAAKMGISKSLFANIHNKAVQKISYGLLNGLPIYIKTLSDDIEKSKISSEGEDLGPQRRLWSLDELTGFEPPIV